MQSQMNRHLITADDIQFYLGGVGVDVQRDLVKLFNSVDIRTLNSGRSERIFVTDLPDGHSVTHVIGEPLGFPQTGPEIHMQLIDVHTLLSGSARLHIGDLVTSRVKLTQARGGRKDTFFLAEGDMKRPKIFSLEPGVIVAVTPNQSHFVEILDKDTTRIVFKLALSRTQ